MITDGDTLIGRNSLTEVAKHMSLENVVAVLGNVRVLSGDGEITNLITKCQSYEYLISFELGKRVRTIMDILVIIPIFVHFIYPKEICKAAVISI